MTDQTRDTLRALGEILRSAAERRIGAQTHDTQAFTMHAIANEIAIALALPEKASREFEGAGGYDE